MKNKDSLISFGFKNAFARGKMAKLSNVTKDILKRYHSHKSIDKVLLDSVALTIVLANDFKIESDFKYQIETEDGLIKTLVCDANQKGDIRVYLSLDKDKLSKYSQEEDLPFAEIFGEKSNCTLFADYNLKKIYRDILPMSYSSIEENAMQWFDASQQIQNKIRILSNSETWETSILFLQIIPNIYAKEEELEKINDDFATLISHSNTLTEQEAYYEDYDKIIHSLYHEFVPVIYSSTNLQYKCKCSQDKMTTVLSVIPEQEQKEIRAENNGTIEIVCDFCGAIYKM